MSFNNPHMPWAELERRMSDGRAPPMDGGDSPGWSRKRRPYQPLLVRSDGEVRYAELHAHSNYSFLDGASHPEELAEEGARLGLNALALTDHDGFYGVVRFAEAAKAVDLPTIFGAELNLTLPGPRQGPADPQGTHLLVLARGAEGYARLARAISAGQRRGEKGRPRYDIADLADAHGGHWQILTGCRKGLVPAALRQGKEAASQALSVLIDAFGRSNVAVELWDHDAPDDTERNDALDELARLHKLRIVATNNVHYATPDRRRLATALAAVRARRSLDEIDGWLPAAAAAHLRSGAEQEHRFTRWPGAVANTVDIARACQFDLKLVEPNLPDWPIPAGHTEMTWLRKLTMDGAIGRYGERGGLD
jgi:error-prone DNA polymerase